MQLLQFTHFHEHCINYITQYNVCSDRDSDGERVQCNHTQSLNTNIFLADEVILRVRMVNDFDIKDQKNCCQNIVRERNESSSTSNNNGVGLFKWHNYHNGTLIEVIWLKHWTDIVFQVCFCQRLNAHCIYTQHRLSTEHSSSHK